MKWEDIRAGMLVTYRAKGGEIILKVIRQGRGGNRRIRCEDANYTPYWLVPKDIERYKDKQWKMKCGV